MFSTGYLRLQGLLHQRTSLALCIMLGCVSEAQAGSAAYDKMITHAGAGNSSLVLIGWVTVLLWKCAVHKANSPPIRRGRKHVQ